MVKTKILNVIDHMELGGAQRIVTQLLEGWNCNGIELRSFSLRRSDYHILLHDGSLFISSNHKSRYNLLSFLELKNHIEKNNINILHLHLPKSVFFGVLVKILYFENLRIIVHEHGDIFQHKHFYNLILRLFQNKINLFLAVSQATKMELIENAKIDGEKINILYNFIDLNKFNLENFNKFDKTIERKKFGLNTSDYILGFAGRLDKLKGCDILIKSIPYVNIPNCKIVIAGDGVEKKELEKLVGDMDIKDRIIFMGYIKDMLRFYRLIDCLVIPSRSESFGLSAIEGQASGVPVIASDIKGLNEVVLDKETGLLFEKDNEKDLAGKIQLVNYDKNLRIKLARNGMDNVRKYSLDNYLLNLENIYNNA
ncbi:MAG: glycosyltransferase family 4 protein [Candidatus Methanoperedens sp.]|nr:glycosyltransferase family 4 protein [Candidatus Methanoperedens sp.]